jgi:hypothetical protein
MSDSEAIRKLIDIILQRAQEARSGKDWLIPAQHQALLNLEEIAQTANTLVAALAAACLGVFFIDQSLHRGVRPSAEELDRLVTSLQGVRGRV